MLLASGIATAEAVCQEPQFWNRHLLHYYQEMLRGDPLKLRFPKQLSGKNNFQVWAHAVA